jgi:hypothetical protein
MRPLPVSIPGRGRLLYPPKEGVCGSLGDHLDVDDGEHTVKAVSLALCFGDVRSGNVDLATV